MKKLETINEKKGYIFSDGSGGKSWKRGRIKYSVGRQWLNANEYEACITKTDLDTCKVTRATVEEHKRFLTQECYKKYVEERFIKLASEN